MKKTIHILFLTFGITFGYSQEYSKTDLEKRIIELTEKVTDTVYFDYKNGEELENPNLEFWINDNLTGNILSTDANFSDNEMYSIFQKIYESGNESDFLKMYDSENPSIRVYGFWAFVKNKKYGEAKKIMHLEKNTEAYVYWNSAGCELQQVLTTDLMKDLIKRMKKYGS